MRPGSPGPAPIKKTKLFEFSIAKSQIPNNSQIPMNKSQIPKQQEKTNLKYIKKIRH
jgi:hypothetical protein